MGHFARVAPGAAERYRARWRENAIDTLTAAIEKLADDSLLRALDEEQLQVVLASSTRKDLKSGDVLINQGDEEGDFAVFLLSGGLKIGMVSPGGREIILNFCAPGELVGEIALLDAVPRTASVTAMGPSTVLLIPSRTFTDTVSASPRSMLGVMRALARRVRQLNLVIESDRTFSMAPRLARALVRLIDPDAKDGRLRFNPSQSDLGAFAGLARENVSRLISEWEERGIVRREGRALLVRDEEYLELLAELGDDL